MEIRNLNGEVITDYDLRVGYLSDIKKETIHHEEIKGVEEKGHYETVRKYDNGGKDVEFVIDVARIERVPAHDEVIKYQVYTPYTDDELKQIEEKQESAMQKDKEQAEFLETAPQRIEDNEEALAELGETVASNEVNVEDILNAIAELGELVAGE